MSFRTGSAQICGARPAQQDAFGFSDLGDGAFLGHGGALAVLADGMGGLARGGEAARLAVRTFLASYAAKTAQETIPDALERSLEDAQAAVRGLAAAEGPGVGTTLAAAVVHAEGIHWISVGDSRVYLSRGGELVQLSRDHAAPLAGGEEGTARHAGLGLTSYLGGAALPEVDRGVRAIPLSGSDRLLLCSDGLYETLGEEELAGLLEGDPQEACERMAEEAREWEAADQDNLTVLVLAPAEATVSEATGARTRRWSSAVRSAVLAFLASLAMLGGAEPAGAQDVDTSAMEAGTVRILCPLGPHGVSSGSGFVAGDGRYVITNHHVIAGPCSPAPQVVIDRDTILSARIVRDSPERDLAILELEEPTGLPVAPLRLPEDVRKAQTVYVLGFPGAGDVADEATNLEEVKVTRGVISAFSVLENVPGHPVDIYQTDAAINAGNSGGPLFDACGALLGVNFAKMGGSLHVEGSQLRLEDVEGTGFAIQAGELRAELDAAGVEYTVASGLCSIAPATSRFGVLANVVAVALAGAAMLLAATRRGRAEVRKAISRGSRLLSRPSAPAPAGSVVLRALDGELEGAEIELDTSPLHIGRDPRVAHLVIAASGDDVARRHCSLWLEGPGTAVLADCWSREGTQVDGKPVRPRERIRLHDGSRITVGNNAATFTVRMEAS